MKAGWEVKTFEECIEKVTYTKKVQRKDFLENGLYPIISQEESFINGYWDEKNDIFKIKKPIIVFGDHTKVLKYVEFDFVLGADGVKILQPQDFLYPKFFYYQLNSINFDSLGYARHYKLLKDLEIKFPTIPEQQRIVAILDKAFASIATAKANTEQNLKNARALFDSYLHEVFSQRGEGWEEKRLGEVCEFENGDRGKNYPNRAEYVESGIPWINTGHIEPNGTLSKTEMNFISEEKYNSLRSGKIKSGDLVYCLRGATLGKTALVEPFTIGAVASSLVIIRPSQLLNNRFLYYFLISQPAQRQIKLYENGAAQPNLGANSVAKFIIHFPNINEQKIIVEKINNLACETQRLETLYQTQHTALDELKKSLLHKAFNGEL